MQTTTSVVENQKSEMLTKIFDVDPRLKDRKWRLENLYKIQTKKAETVPFKLKPQQQKLLTNLHSRNIILKARQLGMSTFIAILFLDTCLFNKNISAAIVADKIENGKNIFKKIAFAWDQFPAPLKQALGLDANTDSTSEMTWNNGSSLKVGTTLHSGTYQCLHISEYGPLCKQSPEKASDVKKSGLPTVPDDGGLIFIESTAEGEGNDFHLMVLDAMDLQRDIDSEKRHPLLTNEYKFFFFPWFEDEGYEIHNVTIPTPTHLLGYFESLERQLKMKLSQAKRNWYITKEKELKRRMKEQFPSTPEEAFLSTGNKQFDLDILQKKAEREAIDPIDIIDHLHIFAPYKRGHVYGIGADVADGVGEDSSTATVIDFTENEQVATYASNTVDPVTFAGVLADIGNRYGTCLIAPENNRTGHTTCVKLAEFYPNVYQFELKGYSEIKQTIRLGWSTTAATKPRMMGELKTAFEDEAHPLIIRDISILREARLYNREENLIVSQTLNQLVNMTKHYDKLIATAIAWQLKTEAHGLLGDHSQTRSIRRVHANRASGKRSYH